MKKRLLIPSVSLALVASLIASPALAAQTQDEIDQSVATYDALTEIVAASVDSAYAGVVGTVNDLVAGTVKSTIGNPQAIVELATPLIKAAIKGAIAAYIQDERIDALVDQAVDSVATSELINGVLTNEFIQAVIARTVDYAVADIIASLGIDADKQASTDQLVTQIWNAPLVSVGTAPTKVKSGAGSPPYGAGFGVNTSYYSYSVTAWNQKKILFVTTNDTPKEIQVTGWNTGNIGTVASLTAYANAAGKASSIADTLANLDYVSILMDAGKRALIDEIQIRVAAAIQSVKDQLVAELQAGLAGIGVEVTLNPTDTWEAIGTQIRDALQATAQDQLNAALAALPWVVTPGTPDESFFDALRRIAGDGASYLVNWLRDIDWLALFQGKPTDTGPKAPTLTVTADRKAIANTDTVNVTVEARDEYGNVLPAAPLAAVITYSLGSSCQFPAGQAPSHQICTITAEYNGLTATTIVEVFDPTALAAPITGDAIPGGTISATAPEGWPTVKRSWTRNGKAFSTAASYKLPSTEKVGNVIALTQTLTYEGLTISGTSPEVVVGTGAPASLKLTPVAKAITNAGGAEVTVVAKDAKGNTIANAADSVSYGYSLGEGCSFPAGEAPSRRTCTITGTLAGITATTTVEVFDPTALAAPINGVAVPGSTLKAAPPEGWPTITRSWTRNGTAFSTASSYKLPSSEKVGNVIALTQKLSYQGLTISGTSPQVVVGLGAPATLTLTPVATAITNAGGVAVTPVAKDAYGNVLPAATTGTAYAYSLGEGCSFPAGEAPSRRSCTITGTFGGISATTVVEVFDPTALAAPINGVATPGATLKAAPPEGWPTVTRRWTRNGTAFSTASSYKLPSTEKVGNVIQLTQTLTYKGLTISGTSPALTVAK
ncbi:MAG: hypothetical protein LBC97_05945 [Bifidobacteriaceae bacterium]|jgi:hypothetical protein|nr:hypothetical protein [Bifidobacteriaceae bacterium]